MPSVCETFAAYHIEDPWSQNPRKPLLPNAFAHCSPFPACCKPLTLAPRLSSAEPWRPCRHASCHLATSRRENYSLSRSIAWDGCSPFFEKTGGEKTFLIHCGMRTKSGSYFPFGDITRRYDCRSIGVTRSPVYHNRIMSNSGFLSLIPSAVCAPAVSVILHITSGAHTELVTAAKMLLPCRRGVGTIARRCPYGLRQGQRRKHLRRCPVSCLERCRAPVEITIGRASRMPSGVQHTRFKKAHTEKGIY